MKKFIYLLLFLSLSVFGILKGQPNLVLSSVNADVGDVIEMTVTLNNVDQPYSSLGFQAYYDSTIISLVEINTTNTIMPPTILSSENYLEQFGEVPANSGKINFGFYSTNTVQSSGLLATLKFLVKSPGVASITKYRYILGTNPATDINSTGGTVNVNTPNTPPTSVSLLYPTANTNLNLAGLPTDTLNFNWNSSFDPDNQILTYSFDIGTTLNFTNSIFSKLINESNVSINYSTLDSLLNSLSMNNDETITLYIRLTVNDGVDTVSGSAVPINFIKGVINTPPSTLSIIDPLENTTVDISGSFNTLFNIIWSTSTDSDNDLLTYTWQLSNNQNFNQILYEISGTDTTASLTYGTLDSVMTANSVSQGNTANWFHRIVVSDSKIDVSSSVYGINLVRGSFNQAPNVGTITSPSTNQRIVLEGSPNSEILFNWTAASDNENDLLTYRWELSSSSSFNTLLDSALNVNGNSVNRTISQLSSLFSSDSLTAFTRVIVTDPAQSSIYPAIEFTLVKGVLNTSPVAGSITKPSQNEVVTFSGVPGSNYSFEWNAATDVDANQTLTYSWQLSKTSDFETIEISRANLSETKVEVSIEDLNNLIVGNSPQVFFHRVIVSDGIAVDTSTIASFVGVRGNINTPPVGGELINPASNAVITLEGDPNQNLRVEWSAGTDADNDPLSYEWELSANSTFDQNITSANTDSIFVELSYQAIYDLLNENVSVLFHRVITSDGITSDTSASRSVIFNKGTLNAAPTAPVINTPSDGESIDIVGDPNSVLTISWSASSDSDGDALKYDWQLAVANDFGLSSNIIFNESDLDDTSIVLTYRQIADLLDSNSVNPGSTITLFHRVVAKDGTTTTSSQALSISVTRNTLTNIDDLELPVEFNLQQNYPNPFNPVTTIRYSIAEATMVRLNVYDMNGRLMNSLVNENQNAGVYNLSFNAVNLPTGVYILRLEAGNFTQIRKMTLMK